MADPKATSKKPLQRCGERVVVARLVGGEAAYLFGGGGGVLSVAGQTDGKRVSEMALHPAGLVIVPEVGAQKGKKILIPFAHVAFVQVEEEG